MLCLLNLLTLILQWCNGPNMWTLDCPLKEQRKAGVPPVWTTPGVDGSAIMGSLSPNC